MLLQGMPSSRLQAAQVVLFGLSHQEKGQERIEEKRTIKSVGLSTRDKSIRILLLLIRDQARVTVRPK